MSFSGRRLAACRVGAGMTQTELAELLGTRQTRVSDWERGVLNPRAAMIPRLAEAVGLDALEFLEADPASPSLEDLRLAAGLSREQIAEAAGISLRRYTRLELGAAQREPAEELLAMLARLLAVPSVTVRASIQFAQY